MKLNVVAISSDGSHSETRALQPLKTLDADEFKVSFSKEMPDTWPKAAGVIYTSNFTPITQVEIEVLETKIREGWIWIQDIAIDPLKSTQMVDNRFNSLSLPHIITAPSDGILRVTSQVNPFGVVVQDQIGLLPPESIVTRVELPMKIYLSVPIDSPEWGQGADFVLDTLYEFGDQIEIFSPPSPKLVESLGENVPIKFITNTSYVERMRLLDYADIALFPHSSGSALRQKSDLELIEAMAHGVAVFITENWRERLKFQKEDVFTVETPEDWSEHLNVCLEDDEILLDVKRAGYQYIANNRLWSGHGFVFERLFKECFSSQKSYEMHRRVRLQMRKVIEGK